MLAFVAADGARLPDRTEPVQERKGRLTVAHAAPRAPQPACQHVLCLRHERSSFTAADLAAALLESMAPKTEADRRVNDEEIRQLNRQGVGRFLGAASTGRVFGVITCDDYASGDDDGEKHARAGERRL